MAVDDKLTVTITRHGDMVALIGNGGVGYRTLIVRIQHNTFDLLCIKGHQRTTQKNIDE